MVGFGGAGLAVAMRCLRSRFQFARVVGGSMSPTFHHGDLVIGRRGVAAASRGAAVIFRIESGDYGEDASAGGQSSAWLNRRVKRIVAVAGDRAPAEVPQGFQQQGGGRVPAGHVAVAGDNPHSEGSAQFGYVRLERIESVVIGRLRKGR